MTKSRRMFRALAGLLLGTCMVPALFASYLVPQANIRSGIVQAVNYASNTVTINGHVYIVSPSATYGGQTVKNFGGLHSGMKVRFIANGPVTSPTSRITNVVVLPPS